MTILDTNWTTMNIPGPRLATSTACRAYCVRHDDEGVCHAPDVPAPTEPGHEPGAVRLAYDVEDGPVITLAGKVEDLSLTEAEQLARAILAQVGRAITTK